MTTIDQDGQPQPPRASGPPADWPELGADPVMTNADLSIDEVLAAAVRGRSVVSRHAGWDFNGLVWWENGLFHEQVWVHHAVVETLSAPTLKELMTAVNTRFGWR